MSPFSRFVKRVLTPSNSDYMVSCYFGANPKAKAETGSPAYAKQVCTWRRQECCACTYMKKAAVSAENRKCFLIVVPSEKEYIIHPQLEVSSEISQRLHKFTYLKKKFSWTQDFLLSSTPYMNISINYSALKYTTYLGVLTALALKLKPF